MIRFTCRLLALCLLFGQYSCNFSNKKPITEEYQITNFKYYKHNAVGPEGLVCFAIIPDQEFRSVLLNPYKSNSLIFKYSGGIYNIDTLYFPPPIIDVISPYDSTIVLGQGVFGLRRYPAYVVDSLILLTQQELIIDITDTIRDKKWRLAAHR